MVKSLEISVPLLLKLFGTSELNLKSCEYKNIHFFNFEMFYSFYIFYSDVNFH